MSIEVPSVNINDVINENFTVIDVRTPKEYNEFHIPGAFNMPIFSDEQRVRVGTAYKQQSPETAKKIGLEIVSRKLPDFYAELKHYQQHKREMVIHCWRGGMRSRSLVSVMNALGIPCFQLEGGIRSFRQRIAQDLEQFGQTLPPFIVLEGHTGTRKTDMLHKLNEEDYPVLDLEGLAGHRGSVFGDIGLRQNSQKQFECDLWQELHRMESAPYILIEAESKRIGRIMLPESIMERKQTGRRIHLSYPFQKRVRTLCNTYQPEKHSDEIEKAVDRLKKRMDADLLTALEEALAKHHYETVVSLLLENYYDPKYSFSEQQYDTPVDYIKMESLHQGIHDVKQVLDHMS